MRIVARAIPVSNGNPQTSTPCTREIIGAIIVILTLSDYVNIINTNHIKFLLHNVTPAWLGRWVTYYNLVTFCLFIYLFTNFLELEQLIKVYDGSKRVLRRKDVPFLGLVDTKSNFRRGEQKPQIFRSQCKFPFEIKHRITPKL